MSPSGQAPFQTGNRRLLTGAVGLFPSLFDLYRLRCAATGFSTAIWLLVFFLRSPLPRCLQPPSVSLREVAAAFLVRRSLLAERWEAQSALFCKMSCRLSSPIPKHTSLWAWLDFFASAASTPFSTIIMVSEMTGSYGLLLPAVWVTTLAFLFRSRVGIYEKQRTTRHDTPIHHADFLQGLLGTLTVGDLLNKSKLENTTTVSPDLPLNELSKLISENPKDFFTVTNRDGKCIGIINTTEARKACTIPSADEKVTAQDLARKCHIVYPGDSLGTALTLMVSDNIRRTGCPLQPGRRNRHLGCPVSQRHPAGI